MTNNDYLLKVLKDQTLSDDSKEVHALQKHRADVERLLRAFFSDASPTIRYGGSRAKGTMIKEAYDLDVICYFPHNDDGAGETLKEIYENTRRALEGHYYVEPKPSALRLKGKSGEVFQVDFHIDVVPGRYIDDIQSDVFLYQALGDKERLKTNLDVHITHVRDSGVRDAIRLLKLWRVRNGLQIKHFALELLIVKLLAKKIADDLTIQLTHVWDKFRDDADNLSIEDPANPSGNDLSELLNATVCSQLASVAASTLGMINSFGWEAVFGKIETDDETEKTASLRRAAHAVTKPTKPWAPTT